jgi:hypothetical protein
MDPRIRIRIRTKMSRIRNTGSQILYMHRILLQLRALETLKLSLNSLNAEKTMAERQLKEDRAIKTQKEEEIQ